MFKRIFNFFLLVSLLTSMLALTPVTSALAATITVTNTNDSGAGSLRQALLDAANGDIVDATGISGTITLMSPLSTVGDVTINGSGTANLTISGNNTVRVFYIDGGRTVIINDLTIANGKVVDSSGGGIINYGDLVLNNVDIIGNQAVKSSGTYLFGGGVYNQSSLTMNGGQISNNTANYEGGGIYSYFDSTLNLDGVLVSGNNVLEAIGSGGGIVVRSGSNVTIHNSSVVNNSAEYSGGGIIADTSISITDSLFANNSTGGSDSSGAGGGLYMYGNESFTLSNVTIAQNSVTNNSGNASGGGIYISAGTLNLNNVTISDNVSESRGPGIYVAGSVTVNIGNTIISGNAATTNSYFDCKGTLNSLGYNLIQDISDCVLTGDTTGNITGQSALLAPLTDNGGPTQTMALLPGSPAIDAGDDVACPATDQRGVTRPQGSHCDIGAYENNTPIPFPTTWVGGVSIVSDKDVVAVGRPHIGDEVASYSGFTNGSLSAYVPMLFKGAYGGTYNAAFYVQNVHNTNTANITIKYYNSSGDLNCTKVDTVAPLASKGYWVPGATCDSGSLPDGWVGGVVVTSDQPIVAVGRPHVGNEVMTYDGFSSGSSSTYIPMLFKAAFGGTYNAAFYVQNVHDSNTANITIKYYDNTGALNCTKTDTVAPLASKGYWVPTATCDTGSLPVGWVGGVVVTSDQPIVGVGRPHIGTQVTTYNGFVSGGLSSYVPMLFKGAFGGTYNAAFYVQNTHESSTANITIKYYDNTGALNCTKTDTVAPLASKGYWVPSATCDSGSLPDGWVGGVVVTSDQPIVGVGRPHIGVQVTTYNGFATGSLNSYVPMLFKNAFGGTYNAAFYVQNTDEASAATVTIKFYDSSGNLSCIRSDTIPALSTLGYWVPSVVCDP